VCFWECEPAVGSGSAWECVGMGMPNPIKYQVVSSAATACSWRQTKAQGPRPKGSCASFCFCAAPLLGAPGRALSPGPGVGVGAGAAPAAARSRGSGHAPGPRTPWKRQQERQESHFGFGGRRSAPCWLGHTGSSLNQKHTGKWRPFETSPQALRSSE
jgi:hypothetical protein